MKQLLKAAAIAIASLRLLLRSIFGASCIHIA